MKEIITCEPLAVSEETAAKLLDVSVSTIQKLRRQGKLIGKLVSDGAESG